MRGMLTYSPKPSQNLFRFSGKRHLGLGYADMSVAQLALEHY